MNFLSHASAHLDAPWVLAGTQVPDWLRVRDRRSRLRREDLPAARSADGPLSARLAYGVAKHLDDDRWFHQNPAFVATCRAITDDFRAVAPPRFRASVIAHVFVEMALDACVMRRDPGALDAYYAALDALDPERLQREVNAWLGRPAVMLAQVVRVFRAARFLADYASDAGIAHRLGQVAARARLGPLPAEVVARLPAARATVQAAATALLTPP